MNRDLRIGLSLSLLALGVAGAFCFRADPAAVDPAVAGLESDPDETNALPLAPPPPPVRLGPPPAPPTVAARPVGPPPLPVPAVGPPPAVVTPRAEPVLQAFADPLPPFPEPFDDPPEEPAPAAPQTYTVAPGDTLTDIAERTLGSHRKYHTLYEANRDVLEHPDALRVGMTLRIPDGKTL
ncbi:LysM peptidoglycan-binding domain-containing protein [Alienimonas californiensis]|uniref:LysM domain/BON superfamily protein n=1 Tax=Alienimonas californiensis TaxID=2527989 RepID=A0A517PFM9_9PLAN|nr:LysM peptidoglycan-binding domain-containing protein [Alienimonas californiensis]QDT18186.1 LysM domain/BON superfamily protein [Alienimonas californiensis]